MSQLVSIVIPCFNRLELTQRTIASLRERTCYAPIEIVCVDDGSTDGTAAWLAAQRDAGVVEVVKFHTATRGVTGAVNNGLRAARGQFLVKLDNDVEIVDGEWLNLLVSAAETFPHLGVVGLPIRPIEEPEQLVQQGGETARRVRFNINGACMLITRRTFEQLGYGYEFPRGYGGFDREYCARAEAGGLWNAYLPGPPGRFARHLQTDGDEYFQWKRNQRVANEPALLSRLAELRDGGDVFIPFDRLRIQLQTE